VGYEVVRGTSLPARRDSKLSEMAEQCVPRTVTTFSLGRKREEGDYHAFWKMYGMDLPDAVLKKPYHQSALRVVKRLPGSGWPK